MLLLIGYRGTGKTAVARRLGLRLGWTWVDADVEVELAAGRSIAAIFEEEGEEAFRDLESEVLERLCRRDELVLATGGGAVLREENRELLREAGRVVWLQASPETIHRRLSRDPTTRQRRPNLTNAGGLTEIETLLAERTPIYRASANLEVDTEDKTPAEVAEEILTRLDLSSQA